MSDTLPKWAWPGALLVFLGGVLLFVTSLKEERARGERLDRKAGVLNELRNLAERNAPVEAARRRIEEAASGAGERKSPEAWFREGGLEGSFTSLPDRDAGGGLILVQRKVQLDRVNPVALDGIVQRLQEERPPWQVSAMWLQAKESGKVSGEMTLTSARMEASR